MQHLQDTYKPSGVLSRIKALRAFYNWLAAEELSTRETDFPRTQANPFAHINIHVPDDPKPTATDDEIAKMLERAKRNRRDFALLTLLVETGARKGEVAALTMADVNMREGIVVFPVSKSQPRTVPPEPQRGTLTPDCSAASQ